MFFLALTKSPYNYEGEYANLYTVVLNSFFGSKGYHPTGETDEDPFIEIIETDTKGRTLFFYYECSGRLNEESSDNSSSSYYYGAFLIMQKSTDTCVYYYQEDCIETYQIDYPSFHTDLNLEAFDSSKLKELNDWNEEIDETKCTKKEIITQRKKDLKISDSKFENITKNYLSKNGIKPGIDSFRGDTYISSDEYGRELYHARGFIYLTKDTTQSFNYAIIFNPDGSYNPDTCIIEIKDMMNFQEQIKTLKYINGWDTKY